MALVVMVGSIVIFVLFAFLSEDNKRKEKLNEEKEKLLRKIHDHVDKQIEQHVKALRIKSYQLIQRDDYGRVNNDAWYKELEHFFYDIALGSVNSIIEKSEFRAIAKDKEIVEFVEYVLSDVTYNVFLDKARRIISKYDKDNRLEYETLADDVTPDEFEQACANLLNNFGWQAQKTKASGDQGADVIAHKDDVKIVIQCKLYGQPVGNSAVQEAHAAKSHYDADIAAVVTNQTYTKSAKQLANTTGVLLLHYDDLPKIDEMIF
jgi:restriction system protein